MTETVFSLFVHGHRQAALTPEQVAKLLKPFRRLSARDDLTLLFNQHALDPDGVTRRYPPGRHDELVDW